MCLVVRGKRVAGTATVEVRKVESGRGVVMVSRQGVVLTTETKKRPVCETNFQVELSSS